MERETAKAADAGSGFSDPISLTLPSSPEYVLLARLVMGQAGRLAGLEPEEVYDLKLAVTEAVTNVIRHASVDSYVIQYKILPSGVEVSVMDTGGGFSVADLTGEPDERGGFGLAVIRHASVDSYEIQYKILPSGVEVSVMDTGGGFSVADLTGEPDEHGGFGLAVIRNLVDELVLDSTRGRGTRLKMIRRAGTPAEEPEE